MSDKGEFSNHDLARFSKEKKFFEACAVGNVDVVCSLCYESNPYRVDVSYLVARFDKHKHGLKIGRQQWPPGTTGLHFAVAANRLEIVRTFMSDEFTKVFFDAETNQPVSQLLANVADDWSGQTPLHDACRLGYLDIVRHLVELGHGDVTLATSSTQWTPLMYAAAHGHLNVVQYLLDECDLGRRDNGAQLNACNATKETALALAKTHDQPEIAKLLLNYGAITLNDDD